MWYIEDIEIESPHKRKKNRSGHKSSKISLSNNQLLETIANWTGYLGGLLAFFGGLLELGILISRPKFFATIFTTKHEL